MSTVKENFYQSEIPNERQIPEINFVSSVGVSMSSIWTKFRVDPAVVLARQREYLVKHSVKLTVETISIPAVHAHTLSSLHVCRVLRIFGRFDGF
jgi:hypothetical protein